MTGKNDAEAIAEKFREILLSAVKDRDIGILNTEYVLEDGNWYLRGYIDKNDGSDISINDCTMVSRIVSKKLDQLDYIDDAYTMEICSKGFMDDADEIS